MYFLCLRPYTSPYVVHAVSFQRAGQLKARQIEVSYAVMILAFLGQFTLVVVTPASLE
jgi:hypothetical protein